MDNIISSAVKRRAWRIPDSSSLKTVPSSLFIFPLLDIDVVLLLFAVSCGLCILSRFDIRKALCGTEQDSPKNAAA